MTEELESPHASSPDWGSLARKAGNDVGRDFGHRLMGLPGLWIGAITDAGAVASKAPATPWSPWHYWWQAHYLDALIDAAQRAMQTGDSTAAAATTKSANALLRGIFLRNFLRFPNYYYDDMAWLALAAARLSELSLTGHGRRARLAHCAEQRLSRQLYRARDGVLGGGLYWSRKRDYKNTPVNGPAALHFARIGDQATAKAVLDWLHAELFDPTTGLYLDGIHPTTAAPEVERTIYSYNQGTVLAALLQSTDPGHLDRAAALIAAVDHHLRDTETGALHYDSDGDAGLFTGILCRYLAMAAREPRLPLQARATAARLVRATAQALLGETGAAEMSGAVQRWTVLEAAATLDPELSP